jgi:hypothetical protein
MTTVAIFSASPRQDKTMSAAVDFALWLRTHRSSVVMAALLSVPYSLISMVGGLVVLPDPTLEIALSGIFRVASFGLTNFPAFLVAGYVFARLRLSGLRKAISGLALGAAAASVGTSMAYFSSWADMLEATSADHAFVADTFAQSISMALIFLSHLQHSRVHQEAARRLSAAKRFQQEARRRLAQSHLQAVQARIEPQLLFDMLDSVRQAYESEPARAEQLLDELVAFLRAALPRLQHASSSVPREAELVRACARLHELAGTFEVRVTLDVPAEVMDSRFPPGVLLPLFNEGVSRRAGTCTIGAKRQGSDTQLTLTLYSRPCDATLARVRALLDNLYGTSATLSLENADSVFHVMVRVPYERA